MKKNIPLTGIWIAVVLLALMVSCNPPEEKAVEPMEKPIPELATIDSLMWRQPDSAFAMLKQFVASPEVKFLDEFNGHYCQVLISELLYKKDFEQTNRNALLKAVLYFDSLCDVGAIKKENAMNRILIEQNVFLSARSHYINGVGFYEQGSIVQACAEYLTALEVMEGSFKVNELTGKKAIFMTYTCNRLMELFSEQFMMDPAIACGERALMFCRLEPTSLEGVSNNLYYLGKQYDKKDDYEKARMYYVKALEKISDTNNLVYRNIISSKAYCDYLSGYGKWQPLKALKRVLIQIDDEDEKLARYMTIGGIYFQEKQYDSAIFYLEPVFYGIKDIGSKIHTAECLRVVYDSLGNREKHNEYVHFLAEHKKLEGEDKALVSKLEDMFKDYMNQKQEKEAEEAREKSIRKTIEIIVPFTIMIALTVFIVVKLRSKTLLKKQQEEADRILGETEQEHEKELRLWQAEADKTLEETKKKYEEELRQLKAETEQQLEDVERKHQQWMVKTKERHEEELRAQKDQSEKEIEKTKKRHEEELEMERLAYQKEQEALQQNLQQREAQVSALEKALDQQREEADGG